MIQNIGIENFRVFKNLQAFKLDAFTILTGANNSGKSALNKVLFLLKHSIYLQEGKPTLDRLKFNQEVISRIGAFTDNISYNSEAQTFSLAFVIYDPFWEEVQINLRFSNTENPQEALLHSIEVINLEDKSNPLLISIYDQLPYDTVLKKHKTLLSDEEIENLKNDKESIWTISLQSNSKERFAISIENYEKLHYYLWKNNEKYHLIKLFSKLRNNIELEPQEKTQLEHYLKKGLNEKIVLHIEGTENSTPDKLDISQWARWDSKLQKPALLNSDLESFRAHLSDLSDLVIIPTRLSQLVAGQLQLLSNNSLNEQLLNLRQNLNQKGINNISDFFLEYSKFEFAFIQELSLSFTPETTRTDKVGFYYELRKKMDFKNFFFREDYTENTIVQIFQHMAESGNKIANALLDPNYAKTRYKIDKITTKPMGSAEKHKNLLGQKIDTFLYMYERPVSFDEELQSIAKAASAIHKIIKSPVTTLVEELYQLTEKMYFSWQNYSVKRHFLLEEIQKEDTPFVDFATQFMKNTNKANSRKQFINKWLRDFEIGDELMVAPIKSSSSTIGFEYSIKSEDKLYPLSDNSIGINMLLLLMIRIVAAPPGSTLILEEPEANLHPAFQSKLAELLADAHQQYGIRFIVETHSEYFIRKLQLLTAIYNKQKKSGVSDSIKLESNDLSIYYLYHPDKIPENRQQVEQLEMREDGILKQGFGEGFFDHATKLAYELITIQSLN